MGNQKSIDDQIDEGTTDVAEQGWTLAATLSDGSSASQYARKGRDDWPKVRASIKAGEMDVLVLWESSRGDRTLSTWSQLLEDCERHDVKIRVTSHDRTYDMSIPHDWETLANDGVQSDAYSRRLSKVVKRGMASAARKGRPQGKRPYGYDREYELVNGKPKLVSQFVIEDQRDVIVEAAQRVSKGESCYKVAQDFNARGIPAPRGGTWDLTQIRRIVTSPIYIAQRIHQGVIVGPGEWPAILDEATYAECVARLSDPARRSTRQRELQHMLSGVAFCGVCGGVLRIMKNRGNHTYTCTKAFCTGLKKPTFEGFVSQIMVARLREDDVADVLAVRAANGEDAASIRTRIDELQARLDGFYAAAAMGEITSTGLAAIEARLIPEIEAARETSIVATVPSVVRDVLAGPDPGQKWLDQSPLGQRDVLKFFMTIRLDVVGKGHRIFNPDRVRIEWNHG